MYAWNSPHIASSTMKKPSSTFNGCPDCIITIFEHGSDDGTNIGYGGVKRQSMAGNHHLVNWDLMRLAMFGKNAVDGSNLAGSLLIHVVGSFVAFYLMKLHADGLYIMTELDRLQIPMSVSEVPGYQHTLVDSKNIIQTSTTHNPSSNHQPSNDNSPIPSTTQQRF